jgi:cytolysin-activating lysine-acyltransferase
MSFWTKTDEMPAHMTNGAAVQPTSAMPPPLPPFKPISPDLPTRSALPQAPAIQADAAMRERVAKARVLAASLGEIATVMMRVPSHRNTTLAQIEATVMPAILTGQYTIITGNTGPIGFVLWATVSPEVDQRLSQNANEPLQLSPQDWTSGEQIWLIEAIGEHRAIDVMIQGLRERSWAGKTVKLWAKAPDGSMQVSTLTDQAKAA